VSDGDEGLDVRIDADVAPGWSWASDVADIPQIRRVVVSSSAPLPAVRVVARAWDGDLPPRVAAARRPARNLPDPATPEAWAHVAMAAVGLASSEIRREGLDRRTLSASWLCG